MSIESNIFPVDGDTEWVYYLQGVSEAAYGDNAEGTAAYDLHELNVGFPTTQEVGYGDAVKSDGVDKGRAGDIGGGSGNRYLQTDSNWTPPSDLTQEFIVFINGFDGFNVDLAGLLNTFTTSPVFSNVTIRTNEAVGDVIRTNIFKGGSSFFTLDYSASDLTWYYVAVTNDSAGPGGVYGTLYVGKLSATADADLTVVTAPSAGSQGEMIPNAATITVLGENHTAGFTSESIMSGARARSVVDSAATLNARFDAIKVWDAAGGPLPRSSGLNSLGSGSITSGLNIDDKCGLIQERLYEKP